MLRALRELSRTYCPRSLNLNGHSFEESKSTGSKECIALGFHKELFYWINGTPSNRKGIAPFPSSDKSHRRSWKKSSSLHHTQTLIESLGWGSICAFGFQFGLPFVKSHVRQIGQNVMDGNVPLCPHTHQRYSWLAFSMPLHRSVRNGDNTRLSSVDCKNNAEQPKEDCCKASNAETNHNINEQNTFTSSHSKSLENIVTVGHSKWPDFSEKPCLRAEQRSTIKRHRSLPDLSKPSDSLPKLQTREDCMSYLHQNVSDQYMNELRNDFGLSLTKKNMKEAFKHFKSANENEFALFNLGVCYEKGLGTSKDLKKAMKSYKKAALLGHETAAYNLAVLEISQDDDSLFAKGFERLIKLAENGRKEAQSYIGTYYAEMNDWEKAVEMFRAASSQGDLLSTYNLGLCYENGWGVVRDFKEAHHLYSIAANSGSAHAMYRLALFFEYGYAGLAEDFQTAMVWYNKAADEGNEFACQRIEEYEKTLSRKENEPMREVNRSKPETVQEIQHDKADPSSNFHVSQSSPELNSFSKPKYDFVAETNISNYLDLFLPKKIFPVFSEKQNMNYKFWIGDSEIKNDSPKFNSSYQNLAVIF